MTDAVMSTEKRKRQPMQFITARTISIVVLLAAIGVSGYLSYLKLANTEAVCVRGGLFDCGTVLNSIYSEVGGIPIAWLGLGLNLVVLSLIVAQPFVKFLRESGTFIIFGLLLWAFVFSMWLIYVQAFRIQAFCPWCLSHEALITVVFLVWVRQLWKELTPQTAA